MASHSNGFGAEEDVTEMIIESLTRIPDIVKPGICICGGAKSFQCICDELCFRNDLAPCIRWFYDEVTFWFILIPRISLDLLIFVTFPLRFGIFVILLLLCLLYALDEYLSKTIAFHIDRHLLNMTRWDR